MSHEEIPFLEETRRLPRSLEPERDLWPGIEARIRQAPAEDKIVRPDFTFGSRAMLAAAAVIVVFFVGLATGILRRDRVAPGPPVERVEAPAVVAPADAIGAFDATQASASVDVLAALTRDRDLDPATVELIRRNLEIIEAAIAEIHEALADDPDNPGLNRMLTSEYRRRGEVLRRAARLTGSI